jgi:copper(I)-binding protein
MLSTRHFIASAGFALCCLAMPSTVLAHGASVGTLRIEHPYGVQNPTDSSQWLVFFRGMRNSGKQADRLLRASSPVAGEVVLQRVLATGPKEPLAMASIEIPANANLPMRHNRGEYRLLITNLKQAIKAGDRFDLTLTFENAGTEKVTVYAQSGDPAAHEKHHSD